MNTSGIYVVLISCLSISQSPQDPLPSPYTNMTILYPTSVPELDFIYQRTKTLAIGKYSWKQPPVQNCLIAPTVIHGTYVSKVVVDNILLYAEDSDTLLTRFECTFGILLQYQVPVKLKKCKFLRPILESWNLLELSSHPMATHLLDLTYWLLKNYSHQNLG